MDCLVCNTRSAVESCAVCRSLLCEDCAIKCQTCGHVVCPQHVYTTRSGKQLCLPCQEKRRAAHQARHGEAEEAPDKAAAIEEDSGVEDAETAVLVASVRKPPPPWKLSLYVACAGAVLALVLLLAPGLRRFTVPWGGTFPTPYLIMLVPITAILWGVIGLVAKEFLEDRRRCVIGIGLALLSCAMLFYAVYSDPARLAEIEAARVQSTRDKMTPDQLKEWREERIQKYKR